MFNMGGGELILVALVALLVIPPQKLPQVATTMGRLLAQLNRNFQEIKTTVSDSLKEDLPKPPSRATPKQLITKNDTDSPQSTGLS